MRRSQLLINTRLPLGRERVSRSHRTSYADKSLIRIRSTRIADPRVSPPPYLPPLFHRLESLWFALTHVILGRADRALGYLHSDRRRSPLRGALQRERREEKAPQNSRRRRKCASEAQSTSCRPQEPHRACLACCVRTRGDWRERIQLWVRLNGAHVGCRERRVHEHDRTCPCLLSLAHPAADTTLNVRSRRLHPRNRSSISRSPKMGTLLSLRRPIAQCASTTSGHRQRPQRRPPWRPSRIPQRRPASRYQPYPLPPPLHHPRLRRNTSS